MSEQNEYWVCAECRQVQLGLGCADCRRVTERLSVVNEYIRIRDLAKNQQAVIQKREVRIAELEADDATDG